MEHQSSALPISPNKLNNSLKPIKECAPSCSLKTDEENMNDSNFFLCSECNFFTKVKVRLLKHQIHHGNKCDYQCPFCSYSVKNASHLSRHMNHHHPFLEEVDAAETFTYQEKEFRESVSPKKKFVLFKCSQCDYSGKHLKSFQKHQQLHRNKSLSQCPKCSYSVKNVSHLTRHLKEHHIHKKNDKKEGIFHCTKCDYVTKSYSGLRKHEGFHGKMCKYQCPFCCYSVSTAKHLRRHVNHHHQFKDGASCNKMKSNEMLEEPMESQEESFEKDESMNLFHCPVCEFVSHSLNSLQRHEFCHRNKSSFQCPHCSFSVSTHSHLNRHINSHHRFIKKEEIKNSNNGSEGESQSDVFQCSENDVTSHNLSNLRSHNRFHRLKLSFQCPHCSYSVRSSTDLGRHITLHHQHKDDTLLNQRKTKSKNLKSKYECHLCDFSTDRSDAKKKHIWGHKRNQKFHCSICTFSANFFKTVMFHKRHHHHREASSNKPLVMRDCHVLLRNIFSHLDLSEVAFLTNGKSLLDDFEPKEVEKKKNDEEIECEYQVKRIKEIIQSSRYSVEEFRKQMDHQEEKIRSSQSQLEIMSRKVDGLEQDLKVLSKSKDDIVMMIRQLVGKKTRTELDLRKVQCEALEICLKALETDDVNGAQSMEENTTSYLQEELKEIQVKLDSLHEEENRLIVDVEDVEASLEGAQEVTNALKVELERLKSNNLNHRHRLSELIDSTQVEIVRGFHFESKLAKIRLLNGRATARCRLGRWLEKVKSEFGDDNVIQVPLLAILTA